MGNDNSERRETINDPLANYVLSPEHRAEPPKISTYFNTEANVRKETDVQLQQARLALARAQYGVVDRTDAERVAARRSETPIDPGVWPPPVYDQVEDDVPLDPLLAMAPYESPTSLGRVAIAATIADIGFSLLSFFAGAKLVELIGLDNLLFARLGVLIFAAILFQTWIYRVYKNLRSFHIGGLSTTPWKAVACWFLPGLMYYRPWQVLAEIWRASDPEFRIDPLRPRAWQASPTSMLITLWGIFLLGTHALAYLTVPALHQDGVSVVEVSRCLIVVRIAFQVVTVLVINGTSWRQDQKIARLYA